MRFTEAGGVNARENVTNVAHYELRSGSVIVIRPSRWRIQRVFTIVIAINASSSPNLDVAAFR